MLPSTIAQVRDFNRTVTQRIGALEDRYLARHRSLGESRVLWEVGLDGCDVRSLRARLELDSGYLSRLLRSLQAAGLVVVRPDPNDRRVRRATLTKRGRAERQLLDERSDEVATSLLDVLTTDQQQRLIAAMAEVQRLITAATVQVEVVDPTHRDAQTALQSYFAELDRRFDAGFDPAVSLLPDVSGMRAPDGLFLVARLRGDPVGCGVLRFHGTDAGEIKRMWISPSVRGLGLGRRMLIALEAQAASAGCRTVRLETNRTLTEAIAMYRSSGYVEVPAYNDEPYAHHWFEKRLPRTRSTRTARP